MTKEQYMEIAINMAKRGIGLTLTNPVVGAVLVKNCKIIGKGYHKNFGMNHAEVEAIDHSNKRCKGSTLFVSLEPCNHFGKTSSCSEYIIKNGISNVIFAIKDPNMIVRENGELFLKNRGIKVSYGICKKKSFFLNESFIKYSRRKIPFIILKCASTLDGRIATYTGNSKWISNKKSREYLHKIRHEVDAILVGIKTVIKDNPKLTTRILNLKGIDSVKVVLDTNLSINSSSKIISENSCKKVYIFTKKEINIKKKKQIENSNVNIVETDCIKKKLIIKKIFKKLGMIGINFLLIEGGAKILGSSLESNLPDKVLFFFSPKIMSSKYGISSYEGVNKKFIKECFEVFRVSVKKLDSDVMIEGYIKKS